MLRSIRSGCPHYELSDDSMSVEHSGITSQSLQSKDDLHFFGDLDDILFCCEKLDSSSICCVRVKTRYGNIYLVFVLSEIQKPYNYYYKYIN